MIEQKMATAIQHNCSDVLTVDEIKNSSKACADVAIDEIHNFSVWLRDSPYVPDDTGGYFNIITIETVSREYVFALYLDTLSKGKGE